MENQCHYLLFVLSISQYAVRVFSISCWHFLLVGTEPAISSLFLVGMTLTVSIHFFVVFGNGTRNLWTAYCSKTAHPSSCSCSLQGMFSSQIFYLNLYWLMQVNLCRALQRLSTLFVFHMWLNCDTTIFWTTNYFLFEVFARLLRQMIPCILILFKILCINLAETQINLWLPSKPSFISSYFQTS